MIYDVMLVGPAPIPDAVQDSRPRDGGDARVRDEAGALSGSDASKTPQTWTSRPAGPGASRRGQLDDFDEEYGASTQTWTSRPAQPYGSSKAPCALDDGASTVQPTTAEIKSQLNALQLMNASLTSDLKKFKERLSIVEEIKVQVDGVKADVVGLTQRVADLEKKNEGGVGASGSGAWGNRSEGPMMQMWREGRAPMMQQVPVNMGIDGDGEREREMREMERKQVYVTGFRAAR